MTFVLKKSIGEHVTKISDGIWKIELPQMETQSANVYLIEDEKLTLIDSGPPYDRCLEILIEGLRFLGYEWSDIELLILTHPHIDHIGGVAFLPDPPEILAYRGTKDEIVNYDHYIQRWLELPYLCANKYSELRSVFLSNLSLEWIKKFFPTGGSFHITAEIEDGERIILGKRELKVVFTPGHSMHHIGLLLQQEKLYFSGDYMLMRGPALTRFMGDQVDEFLCSLNRLENFKIDVVCPSHGNPFSFESGIKKVSELIHRQGEKLKNTLVDSPKTSIDLFVAYFGLKNVSLERISLDFTGVDTIIDHFIKEGIIKQEGIYYYLT